MGSNMAEAHPVGFQWVMEAKARGTQVVHIDPRFTRTSALADQHVPLRAGTDIAFLGGVINYILSNELDFREYVTAYTNASFLVDERFADTEDLDGSVLRLRRRDRVLRPVDLALRVDRPRVGGADAAGAAPRRISTAPAARRSRAVPATSLPTRRCSTRAACTRSSSGTTRATRRRWSSGSAACPPTSSCRSPRRGRRTPAASAPPRWSTAWAGRSTRWARSTSAPGRSSSCCWATSAAPAAG